MHTVIADYKDPASGFTDRLKDVLQNGISWSSTEEMHKIFTREEAGWNVNVVFHKEYRGDTCIGIGCVADQDIAAGELIRKGIFGKNLFMFNKDINLPNPKLIDTINYLKNYAFRCPCHQFSPTSVGDDLAVFVPGNSHNHSDDPNVIEKCHENGVDVYASKNILKGESVRVNYSTYGNSPKWFTEYLKDCLGESDCVFYGSNDYVK